MSSFHKSIMNSIYTFELIKVYCNMDNSNIDNVNVEYDFTF